MTVHEEVKGRPQHGAAHQTTGIVPTTIARLAGECEAALWGVSVGWWTISTTSLASALADEQVHIAALIALLAAGLVAALWAAPGRIGGGR